MESPESMDIDVCAGDNKRALDKRSAVDDDSTMYNRMKDLLIHVSRTDEQFGSVCKHRFYTILVMETVDAHTVLATNVA